MSRLLYDVGEGAHVVLSRADSDAVIRGGDAGKVEIVVDGSEDQCSVEQEGGVLRITSTVAVTLRVPPTAVLELHDVRGDLVVRNTVGPVNIQEVHGDLAAEQLAGPLTVSEVHGDVHLSQLTGEARLGAIHGDIRADQILSSLALGSVSGDVRAHEMHGLISLEESAGDFRGTELRGGMNLHHVGGDLAIRSSLKEGCTYHGSAEGDVIARFPEDASARFVLDAKGTLLAQLQEIEEEREGHVVGSQGSGAAAVELSAGGTLSLKIRGPGEGRTVFGFAVGEDIAAEVEAQIAESLDAIDIDALAREEIEKAMRRAEREVQRARERAQHELERSQERLQRAQERAAEAARRAQERIERTVHRRVGMFGAEPASFTAKRRSAKPKVTDEEQLAILRMVQEGKITTAEAEELLKALER